ncbi:MAG: hypothetical protein K2M43_00345 [Mycoplasmoidaceae bacterium]|nr:hypothetical protein [Mycoplasmoidaceae bacterium]
MTGKDPRFDTDIKGPTDVNEFDSVIKHNIFKTSAVLSMFIALIVIALMIGLIVTLLYKIPGMMAFGLSVLVGSITTLGLFSAGFQLSVGMIAGLIAVLFLTLFTTVNFFERLKKQIAQTYDMNVAIRRGFLSSILSCLDLHIIFLLLGIVLVYFGPSSLVSSGVALVIGCLLSLALSFFALVGCVWLMFFRQPMINSFNLFTYKRDKLVQKFEDESTKVENLNKMTFFSNTTAKEKSKFGFINKLTHNTQIFG